MAHKLNSILLAHGFNDSKENITLYQKLSDAIMQAIINKKLVKGDALPPSRLLAKDLGVSRSTVIKAYEILSVEKYISSIQGSGYFINDVQAKKMQYSLGANHRPRISTKVSKRTIQFRKYVSLMNRSGGKGIAFRPGLPPLDAFPVRKWQQLTNNYWKGITFSEMSYGATLGLDALRQNIANYLKIYRNIECDSEQVVIVTGSLHSLSIIGDLMLDEGDQVILEHPTYANALAVFKSLGADIITAEIDAEGLNLESLNKKTIKRPKLIYTTPSNQYPTGVKMSLNRRKELLDWAHTHNCLIVEDDYDHEFSNWENPITSIFSLGKSHSVIYQGTFNKLLHPSIRLGYLIVPPYLIESIRAIYEQSLRFVSPVTQKVMAAFIEKGYLNKHLRQVVQLSNERRAIFVNSFNDHFENSLKLQPMNTGLHLIAELPEHIDDIAISEFLKQKDIIAFPYSKYFLKGKKENGLVMGYSSVDQRLIKDKIGKMADLYNAFGSSNLYVGSKDKE